ncbi:MarR family winged helix-turn-helix transcriptional regulator [Microbacterium sp. LBN7]|uniref:MarR family winged helix-turn-helix transcriptional regulator n=1 Tax=Microbacterium sp. LBN7 TaxID=3129773 RepID=UPI003249A5DC
MDFFDALVRYETNLWNHLDDAVRHAGAPGLATLSALRVVDRFAPAGRVQELRDELRITVGAASKLVDRLEREGLAVRHPHPTDRRSSLIALTAAGETVLTRGTQALADALADHLAGQDLTEVTSLLARLDRSLSGAPVVTAEAIR